MIATVDFNFGPRDCISLRLSCLMYSQHDRNAALAQRWSFAGTMSCVTVRPAAATVRFRRNIICYDNRLLSARSAVKSVSPVALIDNHLTRSC